MNQPVQKNLEPLTGIGPVTSSLPKRCSTTELQRRKDGGESRIRTYVGIRRQIYSLLPLATRASPQGAWNVP